MSERALLERFDLVADNPENIPLLRRYILDLAVRGKLLEKNTSDITVPAMLKRIKAKADALVNQGELKKQKPLASIGAEEIPATYVARCTFERLGNVANLKKGKTGIKSALSGEFPLVVTAAARSSCDHYDFDGAAAIVPMVSSTGHGNASLNRLHYQEGKFALGTILCAIFPLDEELVSARFIFEYLTAFKDELLVSKMRGTANVTLTVGKIAEVPVPVVAPAIQRRVDEMMALCDQLEAAKNEREARRDRLVAASLYHIGTAPAAADEATTETQSTALSEAARFYFDHLQRFTTRVEHLKQLRQAILNFAVMGKLVPQASNDEPANVLLEKISDEKDRLAKEGKIKKQKLLTEITEGEKTFVRPKGWEWVRIGALGNASESSIVDGPFGSSISTQRDYVDKGVPVTRMSNISPFVYKRENIKFVRPEKFSELKRHNILPGDVLLGKVGSIGNAVIYPRDMDEGMIATTGVARFRVGDLITKELMCYFLNALGPKLRFIASQAVQPFLNMKTINSCVVALPPMAEQCRIVAKLDELMALCDQLETQLATTQTDSRRLLEAVLHEAPYQGTESPVAVAG